MRWVVLTHLHTDHAGGLAHFPDSLTAAGDVRFEPTPGHTPGHMSVTVETDDSFVIIAGDASHTEQFMLDGVASDARAMLDSQARLRALVAERSATYLPTHDPQSVARLQALG